MVHIPPVTLTLVRHGQSEHNAAMKGLVDPTELPAIISRPDWQHVLTSKGLQQADAAGRLLQRWHGREFYHKLLCSPYVRTRQTMLNVSAHLDGNIIVEDNCMERSWGTYGMLPRENARERYPEVAALHKESPFFAKFPEGESNTDVVNRIKLLQLTTLADCETENVLIVAHGAYIEAFMYELENLLPEDWDEFVKTKDAFYNVKNCAVVEYTRRNPDDRFDVRSKYHWRRLSNEPNGDASPNNADWHPIITSSVFTRDQLRETIAHAKPLITPEVCGDHPSMVE